MQTSLILGQWMAGHSAKHTGWSVNDIMRSYPTILINTQERTTLEKFILHILVCFKNMVFVLTLFT